MTTGPALWSQSLTDDLNGSVSTITDGNLTANLPNPSGISFTTHPSLSKCVQGAAKTNATPTSTFAVFTLGGTTYTIGCVDGNATSAPSLWLWNGTKTILQ
jgi:hypothetical protein